METGNKKLYYAKDLTPAIPVHPGDILGEELDARGIRRKDFAQAIGIQASHLSAIIHGTRSITPVVAAKIESGLPGISADFWVQLQEQYNVDMRKKSAETRSLVAGYKPLRTEPALALAEPEAEYNGRITVTVSIPASDRELLEMLARRLGWVIQ